MLIHVHMDIAVRKYGHTLMRAPVSIYMWSNTSVELMKLMIKVKIIVGLILGIVTCLNV